LVSSAIAKKTRFQSFKVSALHDNMTLLIDTLF
jgi:hypothetical protein